MAQNFLEQKDRYREIKILQKQLEELYQELEYQPETVEIQNPNLFLDLMEKVFNSGLSEVYLRKLSKQLHGAIGSVKRLKIDLWDKELELKNTYKKEEQTQMKIDALTKQCEQMRSELRKNQDRKETLEAQSLFVLKNLIEVRNKLNLQQNYLLAESSEEKKQQLLLVKAYLVMIRDAIEASGVVSMEEDTIFDEAKHKIVDTIKTEQEELVDHIAQVVRPGYFYQGKVMQLQEVIIYVGK